MTIVTTNLEPVTNGLFGQLTNTVARRQYIQTNVISGDFFIVPPTWCGYTIIATQLVSTGLSTNVFTATNLPGINDVGQQYSVTTVSSFSNYTYLVQPTACLSQTPPAALRRGIQRMQFIRANFDSLLGQFFQPVTNYYSMMMVTNSQPVVENYQRVISTPDILFGAQNLAQLANPRGSLVDDSQESTPNFDTGQVLPTLAGPGVINPRIQFTFDDSGAFVNYGLTYNGFTTNQFLSEFSQSQYPFIFASFDGSTNDPVVYPNGNSIQNLQNMLIVQVSPQSLPLGTNGVPYNGGSGVTFTATGGQPPYTWNLAPTNGLPTGLSFDSSTATISGTPGAISGDFDFTIQLTDSVNRNVSFFYTITIQ